MQKISFNNGWELDKGGNSLMARLAGGGVPNEPVQLPHDAMIHETPVAEADSGAQTGFYPGMSGANHSNIKMSRVIFHAKDLLFSYTEF